MNRNYQITLIDPSPYAKIELKNAFHRKTFNLVLLTCFVILGDISCPRPHPPRGLAWRVDRSSIESGTNQPREFPVAALLSMAVTRCRNTTYPGNYWRPHWTGEIYPRPRRAPAGVFPM
ncbi:hypothetical protein PoB_002315800 [Plakobranchus ocellatus]|uniref:Uncharacterized protein n=1 Tax=Plakobranchus ocellatus TaxID=259542 RepID=A0AAV3ZQB1_9GAST|nr:hypothetical protein PoB_002315800 [Plakobranchus ocellatus]